MAGSEGVVMGGHVINFVIVLVVIVAALALYTYL